MIGIPVTWGEAEHVADLVAAHFARTGRDPTDDECVEMVETARELARSGGSLQ